MSRGSTAAFASLASGLALTLGGPPMTGAAAGPTDPASTAGLGRFIKNDEIAGSRQIAWFESVGRQRQRVTLTVAANYRVQIFANTVRVSGYAFARSNFRLRKLCLRHTWTVDAGASAGSDRPISTLEANSNALMDHVRTVVGRTGNSYIYEGPLTEIRDNTNAGRSFTTARPLTWTTVSRQIKDVSLLVSARAASPQANCVTSALKVVSLSAD
jgi:hypothetical protein